MIDVIYRNLLEFVSREWMGKASDRFHSRIGIILHLKTVNQINIISFCLGKRDTGSGPLYPWLWVLVKLLIVILVRSPKLLRDFGFYGFAAEQMQNGFT